MQSVVQKGAIPLLAWGCDSDAAVTSGSQDQLITNYAKALKSFAHPVLLRWFWEMNLKVSKDVNCIGSAGPAGFIAAWTHIWNIFHQVGATNVAFVWCPGVGAGGLSNLEEFFPGSAYVDWFGIDGYDHRQQGQQAFGDIFGSWYHAYAGYGKPMLIAETGAKVADQAAYLEGIASSLPTMFPDIKAVVYFDSVGPAGSWVLQGGGLSAFHQLESNSYFSQRD
jgi:beta-mannanase